MTESRPVASAATTTTSKIRCEASGNKPVLLAAAQAAIETIETDQRAAYWMAYGGPESNYTSWLQSVAKNGGAVTTLTKFSVKLMPHGRVSYRRMTLDGDHLLYLRGTALKRLKLPAAEPRTVADRFTDRALASYGDYIYGVGYDSQAHAFRVARVAKSGGEVVTLYSARLAPPGLVDLAVDSSGVYVLDYKGDALWKMSHTGQAPTKLTTAPFATQIGTDDEYVYFNTLRDVYRVAKTGGTPHLLTSSDYGSCHFAFYDRYVYTFCRTGNMHVQFDRLPKSGGKAEPLGSYRNLGHLTIDEDCYYLTADEKLWVSPRRKDR